MTYKSNIETSEETCSICSKQYTASRFIQHGYSANKSCSIKCAKALFTLYEIAKIQAKEKNKGQRQRKESSNLSAE